jgi:hypothetical protein
MAEKNPYLSEMEQQMKDFVGWMHALDNKETTFEKVTAKLQEIVEQEAKLRKKYKIGSKYNVVRMQLGVLIDEVNKMWAKQNNIEEVKKPQREQLTEDEMLVYVYLFNAQGLILPSWEGVLTQRALFDHSINRPIYATKDQVEMILRSKPNAVKHAYIEVAIKQEDIMPAINGNTQQDQFGSPLLRLKQGALKQEKIKHFYYNNKIYRVTADGFKLT